MSAVTIPWGIAAATLALAAMLAPVPRRARFLLILAAGAGIRLFIAGHDPVALQEWPLNDDSHYYYTIAWNFAHGLGLRHDSFHETTGFQPLFLFLIAPVFALADNRLKAITFALIVQTAIGVAGALALRGLARRLAGEVAGELALAVWAVSPLMITLDLSGLETNLALAMLSATAWYALAHVLPNPAPASRNLIVLGALCGISFLARIDGGFLGLVLALELARRWRRTVPAGEMVRRLTLLAGAAALPVLPWMAWNIHVVGSILPSSGQAVRFISQAYGFHFLGGNVGGVRDHFEIGRAPGLYYLATMRKALGDIVGICNETFPLPAGLLILAAAAWLRGSELLRRAREAAFLPALLIIHFFVYTLYIFGQWFFERYFTPFALVWLLAVSVAASLLAGDAARVTSGRAALARGLSLAPALFLAAVIGILAGNSAAHVRSLNADPGSSYYRAALWVNENTPPEAVIGAFQTGIFGYYVERRFNGLDGKINLEALEAMKDRRMDDYVTGEGIDYVMDWPWIVEDLFVRRSADQGFLRRQEVVWDGDFRVWRLAPAGPDAQIVH